MWLREQSPSYQKKLREFRSAIERGKVIRRQKAEEERRNRHAAECAERYRSGYETGVKKGREELQQIVSSEDVQGMYGQCLVDVADTLSNAWKGSALNHHDTRNALVNVADTYMPEHVRQDFFKILLAPMGEYLRRAEKRGARVSYRSLDWQEGLGPREVSIEVIYPQITIHQVLTMVKRNQELTHEGRRVLGKLT